VWQRHRTLILVHPAAVAAAVAAGVAIAVTRDDGTSSASATDTPAAWADGVCTALATWRTDLRTAAGEVKADPSKAGLQQGVDDAKKATTTLTDSLRGLGKPQTTAGSTAQATLSNLQTQLQHGVTSIEDAVAGISGASGSMQAISSVTGTLATMRTQVASAADTLRSMQTGELEQAFQSSSTCTQLRSGSGSGA
jgi:hypothetical protein